MLTYPNPFATQDPEMSSFSPNQEEANSHSAHNPHSFYHPMPSPPPFSPSSFNYDFLFAADALPADAPALPPPDPRAGEETVPAAALPAPRKAAGAGGRRKRFRTDRHSKIHTSKGLRDRRMRLSLSAARQFFRLQDMLGFDKASHTIDWLLKQSKTAIDLLATAGSSRLISSTQTLNSGSFVTETSASECEVASCNSRRKAKPAAATPSASSCKAKAPAAAARPSREVAFDRGFTKESREKARARARERTMEKKRIESGSTRGFVDQLTPTCECSPMNINSSWFNIYSDKDEGNLPDEQKD